jgi:hypothetical protein
LLDCLVGGVEELDAWDTEQAATMIVPYSGSVETWEVASEVGNAATTIQSRSTK